jgi:DNA replication protein DnaC
MMNEPTIEKIKALRLDGLLASWLEQQKNPKLAALGFDERLGLLIDAEWLHRDNKRLKRVLGEARLRLNQACIEGIDFPPKRQLDRAVIRQLAGCTWLVERQSILISGMTGTGKTYVACALAHQACRHGHRALYRRASRLFHELRLARADGTYSRLLARFARVNVLVIDDFGLAPLDDHDKQDLLEVLEDRYATGSTIVTSQLPPDKWHEYLGEPTVADAICDRLLNHAHRLALKGPSRRKEKPQTDSTD